MQRGTNLRILSAMNRGFDSFVGPAFNIPMAESSCTYRTMCHVVSYRVTTESTRPTGYGPGHIIRKHVVVQVAPAVRVALGELFGMEPGTVVTNEITTALKRLALTAFRYRVRRRPHNTGRGN